ncbi:MAG: Glu-tRNA(Gln) amidotransferase subunit GatE [Candidatus Thermoplasmatota archaeon]
MTAPLSGADALRWFNEPKLDWTAIGFKCGLEIHQQLDTRKLFSLAPSRVVEPDEVGPLTVGAVERRLRATGGESGAVDDAARAEADKNLRFRYLAIAGLTSLVELDEEPPAPLSPDALDVTLTFAGLAKSRPVEEIQVMRKTVIDGSNTGGFQRTALVATGGQLDVEGGDVGIWTVAVEEDSARKLEGGPAGVVTYTLDRLGIPLIEVATAPDIKDPAHAQRTAARIGALLRTTGRVKRGLGTIRQDLNVSVGVGDRVEIKGCQDLRAVSRVIEAECRRQLWMHHLRTTLAARGADGIAGPATDVTSLFAKTEAKSIQAAKGAKVLAIRLPLFAGLLKGAAKDAPRLGRELADHAKVAAGVKGIFHSDELPAYGISDAEVQAVRTALKCGPDDAFALCVESEPIARRALAAVAARARAALGPAVKEVRAAQPDDSTRFMRPMPGAARMYPETDVPPIRVSSERWRRILQTLPAKPEERMASLATRHKLSPELAKQLVNDGLDTGFLGLVQAGADANLAARILLQILPALKHPDRVEARLGEVADAVRSGRCSKEAVEPILAVLDAEPGLSIDAAIAKAGAGSADAAVVDAVCTKVIAGRLEFVKQRGLAAQGPLMGPVMAELRGKADGQLIAARLKAAIEAVLP